MGGRSFVWLLIDDPKAEKVSSVAPSSWCWNSFGGASDAVPLEAVAERSDLAARKSVVVASRAP